MKKLIAISIFIIGSLSFASSGTNDSKNYYNNAAKQYSNDGILEINEIEIEVPMLKLTDNQVEEINKIINKYNKDYERAEDQIELIEGELSSTYTATTYIGDGIYGDPIDTLLAKKYAILREIEKEYIKADKKISEIINK